MEEKKDPQYWIREEKEKNKRIGKRILEKEEQWRAKKIKRRVREVRKGMMGEKSSIPHGYKKKRQEKKRRGKEGIAGQKEGNGRRE